MVLGVTQLVLKFVFKKPACGEADTRPAYIADFHYMYFAIVLFWSTLVVAVVVSLLTEAGDPKKLIRTTYWTRFDQSIRDDEHENLEKVVEGASNGKGSSDEDVGGRRGNAGVEEVKMSTIRDGKEDPKKNVDTSIEEEEEEEEEDLCEDGCCRPKKDDPENCHRRDCPKK